MCERCFAPLFAVEHFQNTGWSARKNGELRVVNCMLEVFQFVADEPLARKSINDIFRTEPADLRNNEFCRQPKIDLQFILTKKYVKIVIKTSI